MGIFGKLKNILGGSDIDEPQDKQLADYQSYIRQLSMFGEVPKELSCDYIPGGQGEFGTVNNPIPVNSVVGEFAYLNRLKSKSGFGFMFHRLGSCSSNATTHAVDIYSLVSVDSREWYTIHLCPYFPRRSTVAPFGLSLQKWSDLEDPIKLLCKFPMWGTNSFVDNFPFGLPDVIENDSTLKQISPGLGASVAKRIRATIQSKANWIQTR